MKKGSVVMDNKGNSAYELASKFKKKYKMSVAWRIKKNAKIVEKHLNPNEKIEYIFAGQLDDRPLSIFNTGVLAVTSERLVIAQKNLIIGYKFSSVTPDLYNDLLVRAGIIWGTVTIDTIREQVYISDLDKASLPEIETEITMFMQEAKKKYKEREE